MRHYSEECKATIIARMLPPHNVNVAELARETGIPKDTLYTWRIKNRQSPPTDASENVMAEGLNSADKFDIVIETATMNEAELSAYCRRKGLYPEQITGWKKLCLNANQPLPKKVPTIVRRQAKENKALKAELRRKDKALAETAALLVLKKKPSRSGGTQRTADNVPG